MKSLQRQLTTRLSAVTLLLCAAAGTGVYTYCRSALTRAFDHAIEGKARALAAMVMIEPDGGLEVEIEQKSLPEFYGEFPTEYFQVWNADGAILAAPEALAGRQLASWSSTWGERHVSDLKLPDGIPGRAVALRFAPHVELPGEGDPPLTPVPPGPQDRVPFTLMLARGRGDLDRSLGIVLTSLLIAGGVLVAGTAIALSLGVRRGLQPLRSLADRAASMDARSLDRRFPADGVAEELRPICDRLNQLLERIERTLQRERRFTANVAHELQTPIAELRAMSEVALDRPNATVHERRNYQDAHDIALQMQTIVTTLLALARSQDAAPLLSLDTVDLSRLLTRCWDNLISRAAPRARTCLDIAENLTVQSDRNLLAAIVNNLLSNACQYTPEGGVIACAAERNGSGAATVTISNTSHDLEPADLPNLCEPFWRKDPARSDAAHCGLGLSTVELFARLLQITLSMELSADQRLIARLSFPAVASVPRQSVTDL